ncbi:MAG: GntR family transcriptional regulator [Bacillota bacterium]|nr:GntR family transcriptional regulator [Bacillota bacterium]
MEIEETRFLAYQRVYEALRESILAGNYKEGTLLPTEAQLEKEYGVSRPTIRKALSLLAGEGLVDVRQGRGTLVRLVSMAQNYNQVNSVTETLRKEGCEVTTRNLHIERIKAPEQTAEALNLSDGCEVARIQRVQCADGLPVCIMENYIPYALVPGIEEKQKIVSLYRFLESEYNFQIEKSRDRIYARSADFYEAQILQVPVRTALMVVWRICYDQKGTPVCQDHVRILGSRYHVEIEGMGRAK